MDILEKLKIWKKHKWEFGKNLEIQNKMEIGQIFGNLETFENFEKIWEKLENWKLKNLERKIWRNKLEKVWKFGKHLEIW